MSVLQSIEVDYLVSPAGRKMKRMNGGFLWVFPRIYRNPLAISALPDTFFIGPASPTPGQARIDHPSAAHQMSRMQAQPPMLL